MEGSSNSRGQAAARRARVVGLHLHASAMDAAPLRLPLLATHYTSSSSSSSSLPPVVSTVLSAYEETEVVVIGAGIAGSALAHALGTDGRRVVLIERDLREPNRIVGELLQPGGLSALRNLGLGACVEGIDGVEVKGYAVMSGPEGSEGVALPYPEPDGETVRGVSFHHGRFVMQLRRAAARAPNVKVVEGTVTKLIKEMRHGQETVVGVEYKAKDGLKQVRSALTVVCDGCFSRFRDQLEEATPRNVSKFVGVLMNGAPLMHANHGHVFLIEPAPALAYQISSEDTRMLIDIPVDTPGTSAKELPNYLRRVTAPQLPPVVRAAFLEALDNGQIRSMPNSKLHPRPFRWPNGAIFVGDCYNMRHPLTGGGMSVAFNDVVILRDTLRHIKDLANARAVASAIKEWHSLRYPTASTVNILSYCLYTLFASGPGTTLGPMREACMGYFKLGGICASGPMNLLAITKAKPWILMTHFFMVALYGTAYALAPFPSPARVWGALKVLLAASGVFFPVAKEEQMFSFLFNHVLTLPYYPLLPHPSSPFTPGPYPLGLGF